MSCSNNGIELFINYNGIELLIDCSSRLANEKLFRVWINYYAHGIIANHFAKPAQRSSVVYIVPNAKFQAFDAQMDYHKRVIECLHKARASSSISRKELEKALETAEEEAAPIKARGAIVKEERELFGYYISNCGS